MTRPTWENTFNGELHDWRHFGHALEAAVRARYAYLLWGGQVYEATPIGRPTKFTKRDLHAG